MVVWLTSSCQSVGGRPSSLLPKSFEIAAAYMLHKSLGGERRAASAYAAMG
jgi:hypothetical protein